MLPERHSYRLWGDFWQKLLFLQGDTFVFECTVKLNNQFIVRCVKRFLNAFGEAELDISSFTLQCLLYVILN